MPKTRDVPTGLRKFNDIFEQLCYGKEPSNIYGDYLTYLINGYTYAPGHEFGTVPDEWQIYPDFHAHFQRNYDVKERKLFNDLYHEHLMVMSKEIQTDGAWYDLLGIFYECMSQGGSKASMGQFFTPQPICDVMTRFTHNPDEIGTGKYVSDPTCGSGRTLLSFNSYCPGNIMLAEDLDSVCCKMTVVNFLFHGCRGEVIHHDSLDPESWYSGYLVNVNLKPGYWSVPHVCRLEKEQSLIWNKWQLRKQEAAEERAQVSQELGLVQERTALARKPSPKPRAAEVIHPSKFDKPEQLSLF